MAIQHAIDFNPRPRKEGDPVTKDYIFTTEISIHALAKRATFCQNMAIQHAIDFNPRPRKEGDLGLYSIEIALCDFNPRPRKEGDKAQKTPILIKCDISIHALAKRATSFHKGTL